MHEDLFGPWLATRLLARVGGRTVDLDAVPATMLAASVRPLELPLCLATAWNPQAVPRGRTENRLSNRRLRSALEARPVCWRPAVGRSVDGSWAEPGFLVGGLSNEEAAALAAQWSQLAVFVIGLDDVVVIAADGSRLCDRPRLRTVVSASPRTSSEGSGGSPT